MQCPCMTPHLRSSACLASEILPCMHSATQMQACMCDIRKIQCSGQWQARAQVYSLNWNLAKRSLLLSGSWDDSIKLWDLNSPTSLATFREHSYCIYAVVW